MMRLRALRVADVGRFSAPVAVEKLGDKLNILVGPNELGKSTLVAAVKAVFEANYDSKTDLLRKLVPNDGGAPVIEADFEADGRLWRIRKRFLKGAMAQLTDLQAATVLRNADAQARLTSLLAGPPELKRFGFLWVEQGDALKDITDDAVGRGLSGLLESEIDAVVLDARARAVQQAVKEKLKPLRTVATGKPAAGGAWAAAIADVATAETQLAAAAQRRAEQNHRLNELAEAHAMRAVLMDPAAISGRVDAMAQARDRLAKAQEAVQQRRVADGQLELARSKLQSAERADAMLAAGFADIKRIMSEQAAAAQSAGATHLRLVEAATGRSKAEAALVGHTATLQKFDLELVEARSRDVARAAAGIRDQLAERITAARQADAEDTSARERLARLAAITAPRITQLRQTESALAESDAAFAAVVPEVSIELVHTRLGNVRIDGQDLQANTILYPDVPLVIEIEGFGRIRIAPNPATVSAERRATRTKLQREAEEQRRALGATTLAEAEELFVERQSADTAARLARARVSALAPSGVATLIDQHAEAASRAICASPDGPSVGEITAFMDVQRAEQAVAAQVLRKAEQDAATAATDQARLEAAEAANAQQLARLLRQLGEVATHDALRQTTDAALALARNSFTDARSAADAWAKHPDADRVEGLAADLVAKERALVDVDLRAATVDRSIATLEGALRAAGDEDIEGHYARAQAARDAATRRLGDTDVEVRALGLLDASFANLAAAGQSELSAPVRARIAPYMDQIFPEGVLQFGNGLAPAQLMRGSRAEAHNQLSRGTREQIAILVRLGLARLLADRGAGVPLLLDDALVYADDVRMTQMFDALATAAETSQVIVLTCRSQAFSNLAQRPGAMELLMTPWRPDAAA